MTDAINKASGTNITYRRDDPLLTMALSFFIGMTDFRALRHINDASFLVRRKDTANKNKNSQHMLRIGKNCVKLQKKIMPRQSNIILDLAS